MRFKLLCLALAVLSIFSSCQKKKEAVSAQAMEPRVISVGMQDNTESITYKGLSMAGEKIRELSSGTMQFEFFPSSQLGDYKAMADQVSAGELDMFVSGYPDMSFLIPAFEVIGEPYVVTSYEQMQRVSKGSFAQGLHNELETSYNIRFLDLWYTGARHVTSNKPLNSIEDFKGLRLRTPNVPFLIHFAESTGAIASPIAFQEVYLALQTNQVDAEENPLTTIKVMNFDEVQKYIALTGHYIATKGIWTNNDLYNGLSAEQQSWFNEAVMVAGREVNNSMAFDDEANLIDQFRAEGLTITEPDIAPFQQAMKPFYADLETKYGQGIIEELQNQ